jgi:hypothetical protein
MTEHVFEPRLATDENAHKRVQCIHCGLRQHNPIHVLLKDAILKSVFTELEPPSSYGPAKTTILDHPNEPSTPEQLAAVMEWMKVKKQ